MAVLGKVMNDPTPTTDAASERHLAVALGYPTTWRVCRRPLPKISKKSCDPPPSAKDEKEKDGDKDDKLKSEKDKAGEDAPLFQDVIYAGNPSKGVDRWYCHEAAQAACVSFTGPFQSKGGHMLKAIPKFEKGDLVEVKYARKWYASKIVKRKEAQDGFRCVSTSCWSGQGVFDLFRNAQG